MKKGLYEKNICIIKIILNSLSREVKIEINNYLDKSLPTTRTMYRLEKMVSITAIFFTRILKLS